MTGPTKPAGCFLQGIGAVALLFGFGSLFGGHIVVGIALLLVGLGVLYVGGLPAIRP